MTLAQIQEFLGHLTTAAYVLLALVSFYQWRQRRSRSAAWLALTFLTIGGAALVGEILPDTRPTGVLEIVRRLDIGILLLFPYLLYRFSASFERSPAPWEGFAAAITAISVGWGIALPYTPPDAEQPTSVRVFVFIVLFQWVSLSAIVAVRLWRQGNIPAPVARRRMRLMSAAVTVLSVALVIAGAAGGGEESLTVSVITQVLALAAAVTFYFGFSPPEWVRTSWRRPALEAVRRATGELLTAETEEEVTSKLLPHMSTVVGARGIALFDRDKRILDSHGVNPEMVGTVADKLDGDAEQEEDGDLVVMRFPFGALAVWTSPYSPFFSTEEFELLRSIGNLGHLALEQTRAAAIKLQLQQSKLRRRQALEINDNIVQGLTVAKYAYELGDTEKAKSSLDSTLVAAKRIISELLDEVDPEEAIREGFLVRERPAAEDRPGPT